MSTGDRCVDQVPGQRRPGNVSGAVRRTAEGAFQTPWFVTPIVLAVTLLAAGCGAHDSTVALRTYRGGGFRVGYPKQWRTLPRRMVIRSADFQVGSLDRAGNARAVFIVLSQVAHFPLATDADDLTQVLRTERGFHLLGRDHLKAGGAEAEVVRVSYLTQVRGRDTTIRQTDALTVTRQMRLVDVRMIFAGNGYDQRLVAAVLASLRVGT